MTKFVTFVVGQLIGNSIRISYYVISSRISISIYSSIN